MSLWMDEDSSLEVSLRSRRGRGVDVRTNVGRVETRGVRSICPTNKEENRFR